MFWVFGLVALTDSVAQPRDTLTTEQLLERRGGAFAARLRPSRYLALDVNPTLGGFRRYRFFEGDEIRFRARGQKFRETLYEVTDSTFVVLMANEVMNRDEPVAFRLGEVQKIYVDRRIPFITAAGRLLPIAGGVYLLSSVVNNNFRAQSVLPVAGGMAVAGVIFNRLSSPRLRINNNHRLKVLRTY
ncbi:hypothetical protein [Spirosoma lacussanchae]|uniref:hypothetical protein n=1 Tax=Spirosoma lacussanchae TaxID=1884249 RepID=UPI001107AB07|nr:hypothetical protein [Spirosoma lacussanchae]